MAWLNLVFIVLLVTLYAFSFTGVGWAVTSWFAEPPGPSRLRFGARPPGIRLLKFLLLLFVFLLLAGYTAGVVRIGWGLSPLNAFLTVLLLGLLVNSMIMALIPPAVLVGLDGLRAGRLRLRWADVFHWQETRTGVQIYHRVGEGKLTRVELPLKGGQKQTVLRLLEQRAALIPPDKPARDCLTCGHRNSPAATKCASCRNQLIDRQLLLERSRQLQRRGRAVRMGCLVVLLLGFVAVSMLSLLLG